MSDKCPKCGAEVRWASRDSVGFACGVTQSTPKHPEINIVRTNGCYERQLARAREREATEKARADKLQEKLDRLYDSGLDGPQLIDDSQAFGDRVDEFRQDQSQPLTLIEQRELAQWWAERGTLVSDLDDRCCTEMARAEKAEADLKTNAGLLAHQTDLAREAEIGKVKAERLRKAVVAYLQVKKSWDNRLPELIKLKAALAAKEDDSDA